MTAVDITLPGARIIGSYRLGRPILSAAQARSLRRYAITFAVMEILAGWPLSVLYQDGIYNEDYFWLGVGGYFVATVVVQLLSVVPTVRRGVVTE